jgi:hypothetical protein
VLFAILAAALGSFTSCASQKPLTPLISTLEDQGYATFTPFRTADGPGTVFVIAANEQGHPAEFTVVESSRLFKDQVDINKLISPQTIAIADTITSSGEVDASAGLSLLSLVVNAEAAAKYATHVSIEFGKPQRKLTLTPERLGANKGELRTSALDTLRFYKARGQLPQAYIVLEVVEVASLSVTATLKSEWIGKITAEKLSDSLTAQGTVNLTGDDAFTVSFASPMLIGYKAARIPETILAPSVSSHSIPFEEVPPQILRTLKGIGVP